MCPDDLNENGLNIGSHICMFVSQLVDYLGNIRTWRKCGIVGESVAGQVSLSLTSC